MARALKGILEALLFGNVGLGIPTYVRNDNADAAYQVDSANTVTNEKRIGVFLDRNMEEIEKNKWSSAGYIPGI